MRGDGKRAMRKRVEALLRSNETFITAKSGGQMSTKYKNSKDVPTRLLAQRLRELSDAISGGKESTAREFTMRIPAECDRDADLVLSEAAARLELLATMNLVADYVESR